MDLLAVSIDDAATACYRKRVCFTASRGKVENAMTSPGDAILVFVSHSGDDTWVARQIAREIGARGANAFLDEADIDVGAEFEEDIRQFLDKADELLVLATPWSLQRPYVWAEIGAAWIRRIPIVVVLHGISAGEFQAQPHAPRLPEETGHDSAQRH